MVCGYTRRDLDVWSDCIARVLAMAGATDEDIIQVSFGYGLFTGGFGLHYGIEKLGATVVPVSSGNTERQIMLMKDFGATALVAHAELRDVSCGNGAQRGSFERFETAACDYRRGSLYAGNASGRSAISSA